MAKVEATNDFVWVKRDAAKEESEGLWLPVSGREKLNSGTIISVGDNVTDKKIKAGKGKKCLWHGTVGFSIQYDDQEFLILNGAHIIGVA